VARTIRNAEGEVVKLKLAKHRNGPTGELDLWFKKRQTRFVGYAGERYAERADLRHEEAGRIREDPPARSAPWTISPARRGAAGGSRANRACRQSPGC
jgi:hypothetical protein